MVTHTWNLCSAFNPSKCTHTVVNIHQEQWAANAAAPGEQLGVRCLAQGSHLSRGIEGGESAGYSLPPPTIPDGPEIRTHDLQVTSPTLYPLGHDCPNSGNCGCQIYNGLKLKTSWRICSLQTPGFSLHKTLIDHLELWRVLVKYCNIFISCLDCHFDGTHSLQRICWWRSDVTINFSKSVLMKKQIYLLMAWGWIHFQQIF